MDTANLQQALFRVSVGHTVHETLLSKIGREVTTLKDPVLHALRAVRGYFLETPGTLYYTLRNSLIYFIKRTTLGIELANLGLTIAHLFNNVGFAIARVNNRLHTELAVNVRRLVNFIIPFTDPTQFPVYVLMAVFGVLWYNRDRIQKCVRKHILVKSQDKPYNRRAIVRSQFRDLAIGKPRRNGNVLHSSQRSHRSGALNAATQLSLVTGLKCFHVQPRPSQVAKGDEYSMTHFWASDTQVPAQIREPGELDMITRFDSDYYEDMNAVLVDYFQPHFIYHHSPLSVASPKKEETPAHTFIDDTLVVDDNGAVHYEHQLWDYGTEELRFLSFNLRWPTYDNPLPSLGPTFNIYQLETRRVSDTHCITMIIPRIRYTSIFSFLAYFCYGEKPLQRVKVEEEGFNVMRIITDEGETMSIGRPGHYNCANIKTEDLEMLRQLHTQAKMPITLPKIKTKTKCGDQQASVLQEFIIATTNRQTQLYYKNYKVEYGSNTYQMYPDDGLIAPPPSCVSFMFPISNGAYTPARDVNTEIASIEGRLTKLQQDVRIHPSHYKYIQAFVSRLIPAETYQTYHPAEVDYVFEKQPRPNQQTILNNAVQESEGKPFTCTFVKKENYGKISDPRIISTERPLDKLTWSQYQYSVADFLKTQPWYMFGKTPKQIADRMVSIAENSQTINCTDFSRMDGRKTIVTRTLDLVFMLHLFHPDHHSDIHRLIRRKLDNRATTAEYDDESFSFRTLMAQLSGLPDTSNFNSLDNAFNNFIAYSNMMSKNPTEQQFDYAFQQLMLKAAVAGDDTAAGDLTDPAVVSSSKWIGHKITSDIYVRGDSGVNFLARIYGPDLWEGDPNSCTDLMRTLASFHTTPRMDPKITPLDKLGQKLTSYWYTDENSPVLHELINAYVQAGGKIASRSDHYLKTYWSKYDKTDQYPNRYAEYMLDLLPENNALEEFYETVGQVASKIRPITDLLTLPLAFDIEVRPHAQQVVLDQDGDQQLVGEDDTRVQRPEKQNITIPIIPKINPLILSRTLVKDNPQQFPPGTVNGKIRYHKTDRLRVAGPRNPKTKRAKRRTVWGGITALDIAFAHSGCGWEYSKSNPNQEGKEVPDFKVALPTTLA